MNNPNDLYGLLVKQQAKYPHMQPQDMVKLIYQNEFGGGHMILDEEESLARLQAEWTSLNREDRLDTPLEDIGGGFCRLHLSSITDCGIAPATVNRLFVLSSNSVVGTVLSFEQKLLVLRKCCEDGALPYSAKDLDSYLNEYRSNGYPPLHHSEIYRRLYRPAYRVIKREFGRYWDLFCKIDCLLSKKDTVTAAVDGNSGAGKSTLSELLGQVYDCNVLHMDHFFLPRELKTRERLLETGGNVDYVRFRREVAEKLAQNQAFSYRPYDCQAGKPSDPIPVPVKRLNVVEGVYSLHPTLIDSYDLKVFLTIEPKTQQERILKRSGALLFKRFIDEWIPMENRYFENLQIARMCDLVIKQG
jgi:uridine kinase